MVNTSENSLLVLNKKLNLKTVLFIIEIKII